MADPSRQHAQAIHDRLVGQLPANVNGYLGKIDTPDSEMTYPYWVLWPPPAVRGVDSLAGYSGSATTRTQITAAGTTVDEVLAVLDRASTALHCWTPTIVGRECGQVRMDPTDQPPPIALDPTTKTVGVNPGRDIYTGFIFVDLYSTAA